MNINAAFYGPIIYKAPNGIEQVLVRIPRSLTDAVHHINAQRRGWIKTILENHAGEEVEYEESDLWLLEEMHRLRLNAFKEVAARQGFTIPHDRMTADNTAAMWQDAEIDFCQSRSIGKHSINYFQRQLFAKESDVCCLSDGNIEPAVKYYKTEAKDLIEYW